MKSQLTPQNFYYFNKEANSTKQGRNGYFLLAGLNKKHNRIRRKSCA